MHPQLDGCPAVAAGRRARAERGSVYTYGEVLHRVAEAIGEVVVDRVDAADPLGWDPLRLDPRAEREHRQDHELVRGVVPIDVERRLRLGVPLRLRLFHGSVEREAVLAHPGEDVVARAVDDPDERRHPVARERFAQHADDGDPAADRALEGEIDAARDRAIDQLGPVEREEHLVRGHDRPPRVERSLDVPARRIDPPHDLDEQVDRRIAEHRLRLGRHPRPVQLRHAVLRPVAHEHPGDLEPRPDARREVVAVLVEELNDAAPDRAAAEESRCGTGRRAPCSGVARSRASLGPAVGC